MELIARLRALLRQGNLSGATNALRVGDLRLDPAARRAWRGATPAWSCPGGDAHLLDGLRPFDRLASPRRG